MSWEGGKYNVVVGRDLEKGHILFPDRKKSTIYLYPEKLIVIAMREILNKYHFSHFEHKVGLFYTQLISDQAL